jgi:hypothetical protein
MARYDEKEINAAFTRIRCLGCSNWRADSVRAKIAMFLIAHWDAKPGEVIAPPMPPDLDRCCCQFADAAAFTIDTTEIQGGLLARGDPLPP